MTGLLQLDRALSATAPAWLAKLRREAYDRFTELGFPTTHNEDWKYTNVNPIARTEFEPGEAATAEPGWFPLANLGCSARLVFVNGHFAPHLSSANNLPQGIRVHSLAELVQAGSETVESHLARYAGFDKQAFVALNTALFEDGAVVEIGRDAAPEQPVHLVFISVAGGTPSVSHPRNLILAGRGSRAAVIESYIGIPSATYFTNAVTEIVAGEGAVLDHYRLQQDSVNAYHVATVQAIQERGSVFNSHNVVLGAALARNDINSMLDAEGAECFLNGLFIANGRRHVDNHTMLDHAKPHCLSRELYKGILDGNGVGIFNGKIVVRKDAQKTNAIQSNRNLMLSGEAVIDTKPQLEIFADDVRCTHGATVGQVDKDALFYLQSRGIAVPEAREMLTQAFATEVFDQMRWQPAREVLADRVGRLLAGNGGGGGK